MKVGILAEGRTDQAVISNILRACGVDSSAIIYLRPQVDETDKHNPANTRTFGGWSYVKKDCEEKTEIEKFFSIAGNDLLIIHLDSAEADDFPVDRPPKTSRHYCAALSARIIERIWDWLHTGGKPRGPEEIYAFAIAIEEIDAWVMTLYNETDTHDSAKPKEKLQRLLTKKGLSSEESFDNFDRLTRDFRKSNTLQRVAKNNASLAAFVSALKEATHRSA
ncbi:MAG: hypothetical protein SF053_08095 [Bacteroidia bacterium]|nr:hypothetical protein [Bacteroidia bacterium]